jgi:hypothetical protein
VWSPVTWLLVALAAAGILPIGVAVATARRR